MVGGQFGIPIRLPWSAAMARGATQVNLNWISFEFDHHHHPEPWPLITQNVRNVCLVLINRSIRAATGDVSILHNIKMPDKELRQRIITRQGFLLNLSGRSKVLLLFCHLPLFKGGRNQRGLLLDFSINWEVPPTFRHRLINVSPITQSGVPGAEDEAALAYSNAYIIYVIVIR